MMTREEYLFTVLNEELAEVIKEISKCLRFTKDHKPPQYCTTNIQRVRDELADTFAIIQMLREEGVNLDINFNRVDDKRARVEALMEVSRELGALEPL